MLVDTDPVARLRKARWANDLLAECLKRFAALSLPDWYLGAGCISQTMWNIAHPAPAYSAMASVRRMSFKC